MWYKIHISDKIIQSNTSTAIYNLRTISLYTWTKVSLGVIVDTHVCYSLCYTLWRFTQISYVSTTVYWKWTIMDCYILHTMLISRLIIIWLRSTCTIYNSHHFTIYVLIYLYNVCLLSYTKITCLKSLCSLAIF